MYKQHSEIFGAYPKSDTQDPKLFVRHETRDPESLLYMTLETQGLGPLSNLRPENYNPNEL